MHFEKNEWSNLRVEVNILATKRLWAVQEQSSKILLNIRCWEFLGRSASLQYWVNEWSFDKVLEKDCRKWLAISLGDKIMTVKRWICTVTKPMNLFIKGYLPLADYLTTLENCNFWIQILPKAEGNARDLLEREGRMLMHGLIASTACAGNDMLAFAWLSGIEDGGIGVLLFNGNCVGWQHLTPDIIVPWGRESELRCGDSEQGLR